MDRTAGGRQVCGSRPGNRRVRLHRQPRAEGAVLRFRRLLFSATALLRA